MINLRISVSSNLPRFLQFDFIGRALRNSILRFIVMYSVRPKLRRILLSLVGLTVIAFYFLEFYSTSLPTALSARSPSAKPAPSEDYYDYDTADETAKPKQHLAQLDPTLYKIGVALEEIQKANNEFPTDIKPKTIVIVSTWRSGSTFFADAISSHPAIFYHYEPWTGYKVQKLGQPDSNQLDEALQLFNNLRTCSYADLYQYLELAEANGAMLKQNAKIRQACEFLASDCYLPDFLQPACEYFPVQLFKFVKAEIQHFATMMTDDPDLNLILLLRDPRAIYASRLQLNWCLEDPACSDVDAMCTFLSRNFDQAQRLGTKYPDRTFIVGYEDLASSPTKLMNILFQNLNLPWDLRVERFISYHTSKDIDEPWSTYRKGSERIDRWKTILNSSTVDEIESKCQHFLEKYYSKEAMLESSSVSADSK